MKFANFPGFHALTTVRLISVAHVGDGGSVRTQRCLAMEIPSHGVTCHMHDQHLGLTPQENYLEQHINIPLSCHFYFIITIKFNTICSLYNIHLGYLITSYLFWYSS